MVRAHVPTLRIVLAAALSLLVELTILRYLPGQVRVLGYFTNFVLLAAFVGLGVGILGANRWSPRVAWLSTLALLVLVIAAHVGRDYQVGSSTGEFLFLEYRTRGTHIPLYPALFLSYVLIALAFLPFGVWVGRTLSESKLSPLRAYAANIVGSLLGIVVFSLLSIGHALSPAAPIGLSVAIAVTLILWEPGPRVLRGLVVAAVGAFAVVVAFQDSRDARWSPYQKITKGPLIVHPERGLVAEWQLPTLDEQVRRGLIELPEEYGFTVRVNDDSYQTPIDLRDPVLSRFPSLREIRLQYDLPYLARPPGRVLVLGAGTGNDVAAALRMGATHVDAVEIDPSILELGALHPERPYADPRVTTHLADARSFLMRDGDKFDTIVYGLLDSHVLLSSMSNIRLDSFVFTAESFALARGRLAPAGLLIVSHAVGRPWFIERMRATLALAFDGHPPTVLSETIRHPYGFVYAAGDVVADGREAEPGTIPLRDDWPFVYLTTRAIPREYLMAMALMTAASLVLVWFGRGLRLRRAEGSPPDHDGSRPVRMSLFFFLGAGFLLLETRGLSVLALLIGSTSTVMSAVFAAVLIMALGSTVIASKMVHKGTLPPTSRRLVYAFLFTALALEWFVDVGDLVALSPVTRAVLGAAIVSLPLLASGVIFSINLARAPSAAPAIAANLIGAVLGGILEYASMVVGFRALVAIAAGFYVLALLADTQRARATAPVSP